MRLRAIRPGRDDRVEAVAARAAFAHRELELERELPFGDAVGQSREHRQERVVGDRARPADAVDLAEVLHPAQILDERARRDELGPLERGHEPALLGPGDAVLLEAEPGSGRDERGQRGVLRGRGEADLDADVGVDTGRRQLLLRLFRVAPVGHEQRVVRSHHQHGRRAGESGQVPDVRELRDEERIDVRVGEPSSQATEPRCDLEGGECGRGDHCCS